jgi:hypothetical protein
MAVSKRVVAAKIALRQAIARAAYWRGEAQWKNGYRVGRQGQLSEVDDQKYYKHECALWEHVGREEAMVERKLTAYARALRNQAVAKDSAAQGRSQARGARRGK